MVNLAEKHDEDTNTQLADAEISRILTALQKAEFKRSESGNARPDQTFKPRSLMEIAETAQQQDEGAKAAEMAIADKTPEDTQDQPDQINLDDNRQGADLATVTDTADPTLHVAAMPTDEAASDITGDAEQVSASASDTSAQSAPQTHQETLAGGGELPATAMGVSADAGQEGGIDHAAPTSPFETAQAAYDRGYGDGVEVGREAAEAELRKTIETEFETRLADKINTFESALKALAKPQTVDTGALSASLQAAVVRLAVARTGAEIDQLPELIVTRIEGLADTAGKHVAAGHVFMHPDDCAAIAPILAARQDPVMIEADPALHRGDIRIRFDGMEIDDLLDQRVGLSQPAASSPQENIADYPDQTPSVADD